MPKETNDGWVCNSCGSVYQEEKWALYCEESHETVYVKFKKIDLFKLMQFIITKDDKLISSELMKTIQKYSSGNYK